jgi:Chaperone for flagella basal body P-ring formation
MAAGRKIIVYIAVLTCGISVAGASAMNVARDNERADPFSGLHWERLANPQRPDAPPRLVLMRDAEAADSTKKESRRPSICVRAGDRVSLRGTNLGFAAVSLEATALENGACGERVRARVMLTGGLVEMTVVDSGAGVLSGKVAGWR